MLKRYSGIIGIIFLLIASVIYSLYPRFFVIYLPLFLLGLIVSILSIVIHFRLIINILRGRAAKFSTNSLLYILIIFSIITVLNLISFRNHKRFDTTHSQTHSLSPQSIQVLENLKEPVHITCFYTEGNERKSIMEDRLDQYKYHSPLISSEFIDPLQKPGLVKEKGVDPDKWGLRLDGMSLVESGGRKVPIFRAAEQVVTSAIIESLREKHKVVYFLQGHGEKSVSDDGVKGYSKAAVSLKNEYYDVESLISTSDVSIPEDCSVLVIPGPDQKILDFEVSALKAYVRRGGRLLIMIDPGSKAELNPFLREVGLEFHNTTIVDPRYNYLGDQLVPRVHTYSNHKITSGWTQSYFTIFPLASSVGWIDVGDPRLHNDRLAGTSRKFSWGETDPNQMEFDPKGDRPGPLAVAAISLKELEADEVQNIQLKEGETVEFRVILIGDSDCFSNSYLSIQANENFFLNIIGWLAEEESLVAVRGKTLEGQTFLLSGRERLTLIYALGALPVLVIILGITVWIRRRTL